MRTFFVHGRLLFACALLLASTAPATRIHAGDEPKHLSFKVSAAPYDVFSDANALDAPTPKKLEVQPGESFLLTIQGTPQDGWNTYPIKIRAPGQETKPSEISIEPDSMFAGVWSKEYQGLWPAVESEPELIDQGAPVGKVYEYKDPFTWTVRVLVRPTAPAGKQVELGINIQTQVCKELCIDETNSLKLPVEIGKDPVPLSPETERLLKDYDAEQAKRAKPKQDIALAPVQGGSASWQDITVVDASETASSKANTSLWGTVVAAVIGGLISLATPCVFPMIPITVSVFLKQAEKKHGNAWVTAAVYSGTIVLVMTVGGMALVSVLQTVSQHWITNVFLASVFLVFSLSLLGMFELALPSSLTDLTRSGQGKEGYLGIIFMALTFSIISFACVGPIYGGFITLEASQQSGGTDWLRRFLGPFAFAVAFASPFFILALFPRLLKAMPKSGSWMNSVKVVMGFLELAAAFKFIRSAELSFLGKSEYFTYDLVLGIYVALSIACGLYLLGVYRLPHDHGAPESIGVLRLLFSLMFITLGLYLLPGLFKDAKQQAQKPRGTLYAWVQAFLLPDDLSGWQANLWKAMADAEKENKPLFIDFTGVTCSNCKKNESDVFSKPHIEDLFRRYVTLQLHTDSVPAGVDQVPNAAESAKFRDVKFNNFALPYYVIARVKGKTLTVLYKHKDGLITNVDAFASVLNKYTTQQTQ